MYTVDMGALRTLKIDLNPRTGNLVGEMYYMTTLILTDVVEISVVHLNDMKYSGGRSRRLANRCKSTTKAEHKGGP